MCCGVKRNIRSWRRYLFILFVILMPIPAYSYLWPVLDTLEITQTSSTTATYNGTWITIDIDDAADGIGYQYMGVVHRHQTSTSVTTGDMSHAVRITTTECPGLKFSCLGEKWINTKGSTGTYTVYHGGGANGNECVGLTTHNQQSGGSWTRRAEPSVPEAVCLGTPPVDQWCAMLTPTLEYNYGNLSIAEATGSQLTHPVSVECTDGIVFILRLQGLSYISLNNGMKAEFTTDGNQPLGQEINGIAGIQSFNLTSTLTGTPSAGDFNGTGILFVTYP